MERSKPPKDVLGLGQHLVRELGFGNHRDTLGRWMAHHVAELIDKAKHASSSAERAKAGKSATETILKIWKHRTSLPGDAYPLKSYENVLKILDLLRPDDNPFKHLGHGADTKKNQLAALLFDRLSRLVIAIVLMNRPSSSKSPKVNSSAMKALRRKERHVLNVLEQWSSIFAPRPEISGKAQKTSRNHGTKINLNEAALELIDSTTGALMELRRELENSANENQPII